MANKEHDYEEFIEKYKPIKNHLDDNAAFDGYMYETYGEEWEYVKQQPVDKVFTVIDNNDGWLGVCAGLHRVNRLGYMVCQESWGNGEEEYTISDESEVNEWFGSAGFDILEKEFGIKLWGAR